MQEGIKFFIGLDVHADSIAVAVAEVGRAPARLIGNVSPDVPKLLKLLSRYGDPAQVHVVYEAGPTGYGLQRALSEHGYVCEVIAPALIPKRAGDRVKTDRRDCVRLAELSRAGELRALRISQATLRQASGPKAGNHRAVGECAKGRDPEIDADRALALAQGRCRQLSGKTHDPAFHIALKEAAPEDRLRRHWPMQMHSERSRHAFEPKPACLHRDSTKRAKSKAIEPALAAEPGKARLAAALHPSEKCFVGLIQALQRRTLQGYGQGRGLRIILPPLSERLCLVEIRASHIGLAIGVDPLLQRGVIGLALGLQDRFEHSMLLPRGQEPVTVGEDHRSGLAL